MDKVRWKTRIKKACIAAGTYKPFFDDLISTLAGILERRDECERQYAETGEGMTIERTNKAGFSTMVKNPTMVFYDDFCNTALRYWKELGLTPAQLKKISDDSFSKPREEKKGNDLINLLRMKQAEDKEKDNG